jgi:sulfonate transport system permease protein
MDRVSAAIPGAKIGTGVLRRRGWPLQVLGVLAVLAVWHIASALAGETAVDGQRFVPNAADLVSGFDSLSNYWEGGLGVGATKDGNPETFAGAALALAENSVVTIIRLAAGLALGAVIAVALALLVSWSRLLRRSLLLPANTARMLPLLAMSPLFALWFGNSERGAIFFVAFGTFAIFFVVALTAIGNVPGYYEQYAQSLGSGRLATYLRVVFPASLPGLRSAVVLSLGFGWSMVIAAEFLGQTKGLGRIVNQAQYFGHTTTLAVVAVFIIIYAAISFSIVNRAFDWLVRWAE